MIMYTLHPTQHFAPTLVDNEEALGCIQEMVKDGVAVHTTTFNTPKGESVAIFWSADGNGTVATLWEYTFQAVSLNVAPADIEIRSVLLQTEDAVNHPSADRDTEYAVGE